ncbi:MAG: GntR family transcriptional regulator [Cyanobacteria bacterium P01_A01_bin.45]
MNLSELAANVLQNQRSTPDLIADALREAIIQGIFSEKKSLRQDEIAKQFGVSRIPVREALRQLEVEGLVKFYPNRGAIVCSLSPGEVKEIGEIRIALETTAMKLAIPNLSEFDLEKAQSILDKTFDEKDITKLGALNWEFHATLYIPANRPRLLRMIKNLHMSVERYVRLQMSKMNYSERSHKEHSQLLESCRDKNSSIALRLLKKHINTASKDLVVYLQENSG